jgi:hypothetical protein
MKNECSNCRFFEPIEYVCRRYPLITYTAANSWCGEYQEPKKEVVSKEYLVTAEPIKYIPVEEEFVGSLYHRHIEVELVKGEYLSFRFDYKDNDTFVCEMSTRELDELDEIVDEFELLEEIRKSKSIMR